MIPAGKNTFRFGIGLVVATLLFEGLLRAVEMTPLWKALPVAEGTFYGSDPLAGYTLWAGASGIWLKENRARHIVNSHGMLDREVVLKTDAFRVAVLGNSKTETLQVDRALSFVGQAQSALSTNYRSVDVLNFGLAGATPAVMAARLEGLAAKFAPDLIVVLVSIGDFSSPFMGNDSKFAGYVSNGGVITRGVAFRDTAAYQFRTSRLGKSRIL